MEYIRQHQKGFIIAAGIVVAVSIILGILYGVLFLHVRSVDPDPNRMSYLTRTVRIDFNRTLVSVESVELSGALTYILDDNTLVVNLPAEKLTPGNTYDIIIINAKSDLGQTIGRQAISLSPRTGDTLLSEEDRDKNLAGQQEVKNASVNDPVFNYLPYETLDYSIVGVVSNANNEFETVSIEITVYISSADSADRAGTIARYEAAARAYLSSLSGVSISDYPITIKVVDLS
jgi:hypothetical protein